MTATFPVNIQLGTHNYLIEAQQAKRTMKNKLIKIQLALTREMQTGTNEPETMIMDLKKIEDMVMVIGFISSQTIGTYKNAVAVFEIMASDFKRLPGPFALTYRNYTYEVMIDQLEHTDSAKRAQNYLNSSGSAVAGTNSPQRVEISISFTLGKVRGT